MAETHLPGERARVLVRPRGGGAEEDRGYVTIDDLSGVLERIAARRGPSGPQSPVTQYILTAAADTLYAALTEDMSPRADREPLPRVLSALVGHEPFMEKIELSVQQMRRRWPIASDWYADLVNYILRPSRFAANEESAKEQMGAWLGLPLGEFALHLARHQLATSQDPHLFALPALIETLWPDYPPVRAAAARYRQSHDLGWTAIYEVIFAVYGLRLRAGATLPDLAWFFDALLYQEHQQRLLNADWCDEEEPGVRTVRMATLGLAAACETLDGRLLTPEEVRRRAPIAVPEA